MSRLSAVAGAALGLAVLAQVAGAVTPMPAPPRELQDWREDLRRQCRAMGGSFATPDLWYRWRELNGDGVPDFYADAAIELCGLPDGTDNRVFRRADGRSWSVWLSQPGGGWRRLDGFTEAEAGRRRVSGGVSPAAAATPRAG